MINNNNPYNLLLKSLRKKNLYKLISFVIVHVCISSSLSSMEYDEAYSEKTLNNLHLSQGASSNTDPSCPLANSTSKVPIYQIGKDSKKRPLEDDKNPSLSDLDTHRQKTSPAESQALKKARIEESKVNDTEPACILSIGRLPSTQGSTVSSAATLSPCFNHTATIHMNSIILHDFSNNEGYDTFLKLLHMNNFWVKDGGANGHINHLTCKIFGLVAPKDNRQAIKVIESPLWVKEAQPTTSSTKAYLFYSGEKGKEQGYSYPDFINSQPTGSKEILKKHTYLPLTREDLGYENKKLGDNRITNHGDQLALYTLENNLDLFFNLISQTICDGGYIYGFGVRLISSLDACEECNEAIYQAMPRFRRILHQKLLISSAFSPGYEGEELPFYSFFYAYRPYTNSNIDYRIISNKTESEAHKAKINWVRGIRQDWKFCELKYFIQDLKGKITFNQKSINWQDYIEYESSKIYYYISLLEGETEDYLKEVIKHFEREDYRSVPNLMQLVYRHQGPKDLLPPIDHIRLAEAYFHLPNHKREALEYFNLGFKVKEILGIILSNPVALSSHHYLYAGIAATMVKDQENALAYGRALLAEFEESNLAQDCFNIGYLAAKLGDLETSYTFFTKYLNLRNNQSGIEAFEKDFLHTVDKNAFKTMKETLDKYLLLKKRRV